jgi:hypothetical protein
MALPFPGVAAVLIGQGLAKDLANAGQKLVRLRQFRADS